MTGIALTQLELHTKVDKEDQDFVVGRALDFVKYAEEVLGLPEQAAIDLTCASWYYTDNTPEVAGQRLLYYLEHGDVPT